MNVKTLHPNTQTLLTAWDRMREAPLSAGHGPKAAQHPDLIDCLFVIERSNEGAWAFRNAGERMSRILGRELAQHDYLDFWTGHDRQMLAGLLESVHESRLPGILTARGETLTGQRIDIEMTLAPLTGLQAQHNSPRLLGLYQALGGDGLLRGRPVWRHRLTAIYPPDTQIEPATLKLVANND